MPCNFKLIIMSESLDLSQNKPEGKGLAVGGFVLALVGLVLSSIIAGLATASVMLGGSAWLMYLWIVLCVASVIMSAMGMSKLGKSGGKKGLAVAGLVIGIVAVVWSVILLLGISAAASIKSDLDTRFDTELNNSLEELQKELENN